MPARKPISIVLLGDSPSARDGVVAVLRAQSGFRVLLASAEGREALRTVREIRPDIVLLNLRREGNESLMLAGALHGEVPDSRVVIVGLGPVREDLVSFVRARVAGFIMKDASFDIVLDTIRLVAQGTQVLPLDLTRSLFGQLRGYRVPGRPERHTFTGLTTRDRAVADLIVHGFSGKEIASRLRLKHHTARSRVHRVLSKLAVDIRLEVGAYSRNGSDPAIVPLTIPSAVGLVLPG